MLGVTGVPWEPTPGRMGDIKVRPHVNVQVDDGPPQEPVGALEPSAAQRGRIYRADVVSEGPTSGCQGCRAAILNEKVHGHSEECRQRFMNKYASAGNPRFADADE